MYLYRSNNTLIQTSFQMATKRNIRSVVEDPENIFRFGKFDPLTSNTPKQIAVSIPMGGLKLKWLTQGWRFVEVDLSNDEGQKKGSRVIPMSISVSTSKPNMVIRRSDGIEDKVIDELIENLKKSPVFINRNDPEQFDPFTETKIGSKATAEWFFEDLRVARRSKKSEILDTVQISAHIDSIKDSDKDLRNALFLIEENPSRLDTTEDLYYMLLNAVISDPKAKARKMFIEYVLNPNLSKKELEILRVVKTAISVGVVEQRDGFYVFSNTRLGANQREYLEHLGYEADLLRSLKVSLADKTGIPDHIQEANKVAESSNSATAEDLKAIAWVSDQLKKSGLSQNPVKTLQSSNTLADAVTTYNKKAAEASVPKADWLTEAKVLEAIKG